MLFGLLIAIAISTRSLPMLDRVISTGINDLGSVRSLLMTLGGALFGASAIVSSLVLFAMQVNIERMPHGLFRRIGGDPLLLTAFAATFLLSLCVIATSLAPLAEYGSQAVLVSGWATLAVLILFLYSYKRALSLVNPAKQLRSIVRRSQSDIKSWSRRAERARPLFKSRLALGNQFGPGNQPDFQKTTYFELNRHWTSEARKGIAYTVSYARRYAEQRDYEVSEQAFNAVAAIISAYVTAKAGTFYGQAIFADNPLSTDGLINETLEHLRQISASAAITGDEQLSEQVMTSLAKLVLILGTIEYPGYATSKTHAHLAAAYLVGSVEKVVPLQLADVLMHGLRKLGQVALALSAADGASAGTTIVEKIGTISAAGAVKTDLHPVTSIGVGQMSEIAFSMIVRRSGEIRFASQEVRKSIKLLAEFVLSTPDSGVLGTHSSLLAPYYSCTSNEAFSPRVLGLVRAFSSRPEGDVEAERVFGNLSQWSDQIYNDERPIFQLALQRRSKFAFDHAQWIGNVTEALLTASTAPACPESARNSLRRNAVRLISVLSWVPEERQTIAFIESIQLTEMLFAVSDIARRLGCTEESAEIDKLLLQWGVKAGGHLTGWNVLEKSLFGLISSELSNIGQIRNFSLLHALQEQLQDGNLIDRDTRREAAATIRNRVQNLDGYHEHSRIFYALRRHERAALVEKAEQVADVLGREIDE